MIGEELNSDLNDPIKHFSFTSSFKKPESNKNEFSLLNAEFGVTNRVSSI